MKNKSQTINTRRRTNAFKRRFCLTVQPFGNHCINSNFNNQIINNK